MARSVSTDPYHGFRFHIVDPAGGNLDPVAGFKTATMPEVSAPAVNYREGVYLWTRKYPGVPEVGDVTFETGIFRRESSFFEWIKRVVEGGAAEYRTDLIVQQYHISDEFGIDGAPSRVTRLKEAFPVTVKPTGDFDSEGADVQLQSITLAVEEMEVELFDNGNLAASP